MLKTTDKSNLRCFKLLDFLRSRKMFIVSSLLFLVISFLALNLILLPSTLTSHEQDFEPPEIVDEMEKDQAEPLLRLASIENYQDPTITPLDPVASFWPSSSRDMTSDQTTLLSSAEERTSSSEDLQPLFTSTLYTTSKESQMPSSDQLVKVTSVPTLQTAIEDYPELPTVLDGSVQLSTTLDYSSTAVPEPTNIADELIFDHDFDPEPPTVLEPTQDDVEKNVAVCIMGNEGEAILLNRTVHHNREALLSDDVDLFLYLQVDVPIYASKSEDDLPYGTTDFFNTTLLLELYKPWLKKAVIFRDDQFEKQSIKFDDAHYWPKKDNAKYGWNWARRMMYKWKRCHQTLVVPEEVKRGKPYDVIVRSRPDVLLLEKPVLDLAREHPNYLFTSSGDCGLTPKGEFPGWKGCGLVLMDLAFFGSSYIMGIALRAYDIILSRISDYRCPESYPEFMFGWAMEIMNVKTMCGGMPFARYGKTYNVTIPWPPSWGYNMPKRQRIWYCDLDNPVTMREGFGLGNCPPKKKYPNLHFQVDDIYIAPGS
ncbi:hypothetical protein EDD86DRAFT_85320 [Gorgonomyces haynaldii]|nr:hypothetical protein EDD86DRAFT_85320 [Gorgonomyces haynaldii]